jgi:hypothetical protein
MMRQNGPRVFLSYGRPAAVHAERLYAELTAHGADVWFDQKSLRGGEKWDATIRKAISSCRYFVLLMSSAVVTRRGFFNREIGYALRVLSEFSEGEIFLIPVRLDRCAPSFERLSELQWVDLFPDWGVGIFRLLQAVGLGRANKNTSLLDISVCAYCGHSNFEIAHIHVSYLHALVLRCKDCDWRFISEKEIYDYSESELTELARRYGQIRYE